MTTAMSVAPGAHGALEAPLAAFEQFEKEFAGACPPWLRALRTSGISYFGELGYPTSHQEEWRFTNPAPLVQFPFILAAFVPAAHPRPEPLPPNALDHFAIGEPAAGRLVFVDGFHVPEASFSPALPAGVVVCSLAQAIREHPDLVENSLGRAARHESNAFAALNTAFIRDGAFICIPPNLDLPGPLHLLFVATQAGTVNQPRNVIVARSRSRAQIIEEHVSLGEAACFTNSVTEILAGGNAFVEHLKIQRENTASLHVALVEARQHRNSRVHSHSISLGARLARINIHLHFEEDGCDSILNGLYLAMGDQLVDHHTLANHARPRCRSHEFYHGILGGAARGVFNGKILVRHDAQKTDAKQTNRNLLLSNEASINTKPQLEILADDVKCTHGATVGQVQEEALFYLRSRGIGELEARHMLIQAFASEIFGRIGIAGARPVLEQMVAEKLNQNEGAAAAEDGGNTARKLLAPTTLSPETRHV